MTPEQLLYHQSLDFLLGRKVQQDEARAFALNAKAAAGGHHDAVLAMGWFYANGVGVEQNTQKAREWFRRSARQSEPKAMFSLGQIAYDTEDFPEALAWFTQAANAGHARSLYWIGKCYWRGQGVEQDKKQAKVYFQRAASRKVHEAQRVLRFLR